MWKAMVRTAAATAAFGLVHSVLASRRAKRAAGAVFGGRNRDGLYRLSYSAFAVGSLGGLVLYARRQPGGEVYHIRGFAAGLMNGGRAAGLAYAAWAVYRARPAYFLGLENALQWLTGAPVAPDPQGQGPSPDAEGRLDLGGPFASSRNPLNFAMLPILWLTPRMTGPMLAFNLTATAYLVVGANWSERRLLETFGAEFQRYREGAVPFLVPLLPPAGEEANGGPALPAP